MQDLVNTFMLICGALAAMGFGVLVAYATCKATFAILRAHARSIHQEKQVPVEPTVARVS